MIRDRQDCTEKPLVSVAMPVYNAGRHLRLAVLSILRQTFTNWELLIIDDGSTDNSIEEIADLLDERIHIVKDGENKGLAVRLNEAIDLARGRYFARMDQDDVSYPERFERQVQALENDPRLDLVAIQAVAIDDDNRIIGVLPGYSANEEISLRPWRGFYLPHPTWLGRIEWFRNYRYREPGPYFCEDHELLLRSYEESRFGIINEVLFAYRLKKSIDWQKLMRTRLTLLMIQLSYFFPRRRFRHAFMAIVVYGGRSLLDLARAVSGFRYPLVRPRDEALFIKWKNVLKSF